MRRAALWLFVVLGPLGLACKSQDDDSSIEEQFVVTGEKMADIIVANAKDCDKIANALAPFVEKNHDVFQKWNEHKKKLTPEQKEAFYQKYKGRTRATAERMDPIVEACGDNKALMDRMRQLNE